jgi:hypothetical protein
MRKFAAVFVLLALTLTACSSLKSYLLGDIIPPLYDTSTQTVYVEKVTLTNNTSGVSVEFDSASEQDLLRMQFEGIRCTRSEIVEELTPKYTVIFTTRDGDFTLKVISEAEFVIGEFYYEAVRFSADLVVLESLTS